MPASGTPPLMRLAIIGATGRMGQALLRAAPGFPELIVTAAVASPGSLALGRDAGTVAGIGALNLPVTSDLPAALTQADVAVDFSQATAVAASLAACRVARRPLLIGTTGYGGELEPLFAAAAHDIALLIAPNTSLAVAVLTALTLRAAQALPVSFDIDILDLHHRTKPDAPSGTALALGRAAVRGSALAGTPRVLAGAAHDPAQSLSPRPPGEIRFAAVRAGDLVGEHTVRFSGTGEELVLTHRASERSIFARGALAAALWLASRPPGRYDMADLLRFKSDT